MADFFARAGFAAGFFAAAAAGFLPGFFLPLAAVEPAALLRVLEAAAPFAELVLFAELDFFAELVLAADFLPVVFLAVVVAAAPSLAVARAGDFLAAVRVDAFAFAAAGKALEMLLKAQTKP